MATFLNWRTSDIGSRDRITADLFSYLSSRWYPVNVIGSSIYDVFSTYAKELSSASVEVSQTYNDLFIKSVRTSPVGTNSSSKMYDNFGTLLGVGKLYNQDYEYYSNFYSLQSYRQQLRLLGEAFFSGMSVEGINRVGQAYTGIAPIVIQPLKFYDGWVLTTYTGSVLATGNNIIGIDQDIPRIGHYIPTGSVASFFVSDTYGISNSVLGYNTFARSTQYYYAGMSVYIYAASGSFLDASFRNSIEYSINRTLKADQKPVFIYSDQYVSYRPSTGSVTGSILNDVFALSPQGYLYNYSPTGATGSVFVGNVIVPILTASLWDISYWDSSVVWDPSTYIGDYDLYYDWLVLTRNDAYYVMSLRTYPEVSIPSTVYYQDFNSNPISRLNHATGSSNVAHWIFEDPSNVWSVSETPVNLSIANGITIYGSESVPNGGFEFHTGVQDNGITDTFTGWQLSTASMGGYADSSALCHSGTGSLKLVGNDNKLGGATGSFASASSSVGIDPYSLYHFEYWSMGDGTHSGFLRLKSTGSAGPQYLQANSTWGNTEFWFSTNKYNYWSKYATDFVAPSGSSSFLVTIGSPDSTPYGYTYFDDISLKKKTYGVTQPAWGRSENWTGREIIKAPFVASALGSSYLKFSNSFYFETWVDGVDKTIQAQSASSSLKNFFLKKQVSPSGSVNPPFSLDGLGYAFGLDFVSQHLKLMYTSGGVQQVYSASISSYMSEEPSRYHYFAGTYFLRNLYLYVDDKVVYYNPLAAQMDTLPTTGNIYMAASGSLASGSLTLGTGSITVDEFVASTGFLDPTTAKMHFETTKPRHTRLGVRGDEVELFQQPKVTVYASGSNEFEFHQFTARWLPAGESAFFDKKLVDVYRLPLYKV